MERPGLFRVRPKRPGSGASGPALPALERSNRFSAWVLITLLLAVPCFPPFSAAEEPELPTGPTRSEAGPDGPRPWKQRRFPDPVLVPGDLLPGLADAEIRGLRLFRWRDGRFETIRFQVDERTPDLDWVFPFGKKNNASQGNLRLDGRDVLLFMARDAGEQAPGAASISGVFCPPEEIALKDPVDGSVRWVYLAFFLADPPPLCPLPDYVRYNYEKEEIESDCVFSKFMITPDGLHTSFSEQGGVPRAAGGNGDNRIDRLKFRVEIRFFFNLIPLRVNEESMGQDMVAYIQGPVRVVRRMEQFMKLPFGARGLKSFSDANHYEGVVVVPIEVHVPRGLPALVSHANLSFGMDFAPPAIGAWFRNSENPEPLLIDGRMSPSEQRFCTRRDRWRMVYGPGGTYMSRSLVPGEVASMLEIRQEYEDDLSRVRRPENSPGSIGFSSTDMEMVRDRVRPGRHRFFMDVYFPPRYEIGDEAAYMDLRNRPLQIVVGDRFCENRLNVRGEIGEDFTRGTEEW